MHMILRCEADYLKAHEECWDRMVHLIENLPDKFYRTYNLSEAKERIAHRIVGYISVIHSCFLCDLSVKKVGFEDKCKYCETLTHIYDTKHWGCLGGLYQKVIICPRPEALKAAKLIRDVFKDDDEWYQG